MMKRVNRLTLARSIIKFGMNNEEIILRFLIDHLYLISDLAEEYRNLISQKPFDSFHVR